MALKHKSQEKCEFGHLREIIVQVVLVRVFIDLPLLCPLFYRHMYVSAKSNNFMFISIVQPLQYSTYMPRIKCNNTAPTSGPLQVHVRGSCFGK